MGSEKLPGIDDFLKDSNSLMVKAGKAMKNLNPALATVMTSVAGVGMFMAGTCSLANLDVELAKQGVELSSVATQLSGGSMEQVGQYISNAFQSKNNLVGENLQGMGMGGLAAAPAAGVVTKALKSVGDWMAEKTGRKPDLSKDIPAPTLDSAMPAPAGMKR